jgi:thiol-disulfide isomerase/thioredoxin
MRRRWTAVLVLGLAALVGRAGEQPAKAPQKSPAFEALKKEYDTAQKKFADEIRVMQQAALKALKEATTDEEKQAAQKKLRVPITGNPAPQFSPKFLEFAEKNPKDPAAVDALVLALNTSGGPTSKVGTFGKAVTCLQNYVTQPEIKRAVRLLANVQDEAAEKVVRDVMARNPDRAIQAVACKALWKRNENAAKSAAQLESNPALRKAIEAQRGKDFVEKLLAQADTAKEQAEQLQKVLREKYGDVFPDLSVGKTAPEVISRDLDGKEVRLSALRGKVVVLDIWATWCGPCIAMIPHEREMVARLKDKPFVLVSISADAQKETLTKFLAKEMMPWTHWWNGAQGGILEDWDVEFFPTIYVLDAQGVIRHKNIRGAQLEEAVNELIRKMEVKKAN